MKAILLGIIVVLSVCPMAWAADDIGEAAEPPLEDAPAKEPEPKNPLRRTTENREARPGWVLLSDQSVITGNIYSSLGKPLSIFNRAEKKYNRIDWRDVAHIDVELEKNILERDWRWKESGSDVKVFTDLYYFSHEYCITLFTRDGQEIVGDCAAPIYVLEDGQEKAARLILHKKDKGEKAGEYEAKQPVYIRSIVLTDIEGAPEAPAREEERPAEEEKQQEAAEEL